MTVRAGARAILDAVSLAIAPGETVALVGPNGAGKSTLLRVLSGELAADAGTVVLKGREPRAYEPRVLALHRAVLSQHTSVAFPFSVAEVVRMGAGDRRGAAVEPLVDAALAEVDLAGFRERIITTLSGGEQQRAHFARVLVQLACGEAAHGPGVLLLDEPTASLDLRHQLDVLDGDAAAAPRAASPWWRSCTTSIWRRCSPSVSWCCTTAASPPTARRSRRSPMPCWRACSRWRSRSAARRRPARRSCCRMR